MHIYSSSLEPVFHVPSCGVTEYNLPTQKLSIAKAEINGRYPLTGRSRNTVCEQTYYIISGTGTIHTKNNTYEIIPGNVFMFAIGERYHVQGENLEVVIHNTPARSIEQYEMSE